MPISRVKIKRKDCAITYWMWYCRYLRRLYTYRSFHSINAPRRHECQILICIHCLLHEEVCFFSAQQPLRFLVLYVFDLSFIIYYVHLANKNKKNWMCIIGHPYLQIHPDYQHSNPTCSPLFSDHPRSRFIHIILFIIYYAHLANKRNIKVKSPCMYHELIYFYNSKFKVSYIFDEFINYIVKFLHCARM